MSRSTYETRRPCKPGKHISVAHHQHCELRRQRAPIGPAFGDTGRANGGSRGIRHSLVGGLGLLGLLQLELQLVNGQALDFQKLDPEDAIHRNAAFLAYPEAADTRLHTLRGMAFMTLSWDQQNSNVRRISLKGLHFDVVRCVGDADYDHFWDQFMGGHWEPTTLHMIENFSDKGVRFYDVGGWIGATSIWAALHGCEVFSFEPDPIALIALRANIDLNPEIKKQITVIPAAAGGRSGTMELYAAQFGMSETSAFSKVQRGDSVRRSGKSVNVPVVSLPDFILSRGSRSSQQFIKMDIEGGEFQLLPDIDFVINSFDIPIYVEVHPLNILSDNIDHTFLERVYACARILDCFKECHWYALNQNTCTEASKTSTLAYFLKNLDKSFQMLISKNPITWSA